MKRNGIYFLCLQPRFSYEIVNTKSGFLLLVKSCRPRTKNFAEAVRQTDAIHFDMGKKWDFIILLLPAYVSKMQWIEIWWFIEMASGFVVRFIADVHVLIIKHEKITCFLRFQGNFSGKNLNSANNQNETFFPPIESINDFNKMFEFNLCATIKSQPLLSFVFLCIQSTQSIGIVSQSESFSFACAENAHFLYVNYRNNNAM